MTTSEITATDFFCGTGGSSTGMAAAGVRVVMAANHWKLAVETHNTNHPEADHDCADISQVDPRRYPSTTIGWFSPSCTNHSIAKSSNRQQKEAPVPPGSLYPPLSSDASERSRATMWDVVRMSEYHNYQAVVVENVVDASKWVLFEAWLLAMHNLGYKHEIVCLNSMFAGDNPAPQSRDRIYVVFFKANAGRSPVLAIRPKAQCDGCQQVVESVQSWKNPSKQVGKYKQQYVYRCTKCSSIVEPFTLPAASALDWTIPTQRIGDRKKELAAGTMRRIQAGLDKYGRPATTPLLIPVDRNGDDNKQGRSVWQPLATQTARATMGLAVPTAFITELRGGGSHARSVNDPLATVTAAGNHHYLTIPAPAPVAPPAMLVPYYRTGVAKPVTMPMGTLTTIDRNALVSSSTSIEDCTFRMLDPNEIKRAMAFPDEYTVLGSKRERVRQLGNAVTPPAARIILTAIVEMLTGQQATESLAA